MARETNVLCGGISPPGRSAKTLQLSVRGPRANISLKSEDIGKRMLQALPATLADLLDVATYVFAADQLVSRGGDSARGLGSDWRRNFRFVIPVRDPELWSSPEVSKCLEDLVGFMSEDRMSFEFTESVARHDGSDYFDFGAEFEEVVLFSGCLDSLTGTVDRLANGTARLLLVSHQSSTKIANRQKQLARDLSGRFPGRLVHVPTRILLRGVNPVERTQRTRSLLFGALGAIVARIAGPDGFSLFENGIVSFNLPIASQVVGTAATRTTHPRVIRDLSRFLSTLLNTDFTVANPYVWKTKGEVISRLRDLGHSDLARHTVSCSRVYWMTKLHTHCGCCSQCLDRRFAALSVGLDADDPEEMYETDLLTGAREGQDRVMAESFVRHALELADLSDRTFMSRFAGEIARVVSCIPGLPAGETAREILNLHHRHSAAVRFALEDGFRRYAQELAGQTLPSSCVLRMVAGPADLAPPAARTAEPQVDRFDSHDSGRTSQLRIALDVSNRRFLIEGIPAIAGETIYLIMEALIAKSRSDRQDGRAPEKHSFTTHDVLSRASRVTETSLRRAISRLRKHIHHAFELHAGIPLSSDALIENVPWRGYRLNPAVVILAPQEIETAG